MHSPGHNSPWGEWAAAQDRMASVGKVAWAAVVQGLEVWVCLCARARLFLGAAEVYRSAAGHMTWTASHPVARFPHEFTGHAPTLPWPVSAHRHATPRAHRQRADTCSTGSWI